LDHETIDACDHIVAVMGPEPYVAALQAGANIILGGRTTDTAVLASFALLNGVPPGASWHAAKSLSWTGTTACGLQNSPPQAFEMGTQASISTISALSGTTCGRGWRHRAL